MHSHTHIQPMYSHFLVLPGLASDHPPKASRKTLGNAWTGFFQARYPYSKLSKSVKSPKSKALKGAVENIMQYISTDTVTTTFHIQYLAQCLTHAIKHLLCSWDISGASLQTVAICVNILDNIVCTRNCKLPLATHTPVSNHRQVTFYCKLPPPTNTETHT